MTPGLPQFLKRLDTRLQQAEKQEGALLEVLKGLVELRAELQAFKQPKRRKAKCATTK